MSDDVHNLPDDHDEDEEQIDPRIQAELDNLNGASETINHLEILHAEATNKFRFMNDAAINELKRLKKSLGKSVDKARPYYEARKQARQIQMKTQNAARSYQRASGLYDAAKETIALAEDRLTSKDQHEIDPAWQEMLNHAIMKVYETEKEKSRTEQEHRLLAARLASSERDVSSLASKFTSSINKTRPYFERRSFLEDVLEDQKQKIGDLSSSIQSAKLNYKTSLNNLEQISEEIHHVRKQKRLLARLPPREPCIGAENDEILTEDQLEINLDNYDTLSVSSSQTGNSEATCDIDNESETMQELRKTLERCHSNDPTTTLIGSDIGDYGNNDRYHSNSGDRRHSNSNSADRRHSNVSGHEEVFLHAEVLGSIPGEVVPKDAAVLETKSSTYLPTSPAEKHSHTHPTVFSVENRFLSEQSAKN